jgi:hypothetical protein
MGDDLKTTIAKLIDLDHATLKKRWSEIFDIKVPARMSRSLLRYAIAYRLQENALGGLSPATQRHLERFMDNGKPAVRPGTAVKPGTRLLREWHGYTYEVIVLDQGVMFKGQRYRSLSQVARKITGAKWSGPTFFGLRGKPHG